MSAKANASGSHQLSQDEVNRIWARFRTGDPVRCERDRASFALSVDGAAKAYRLVCTKCGLASPWFGATPSGLIFRSAHHTTSATSPTGEG